jgi:hypothetical protein
MGRDSGLQRCVHGRDKIAQLINKSLGSG